MSTCISREGEYGSHKFGTNGAERFTCRRCWVFDEDAAYAALTAAESRLASVEALADEWEAEVRKAQAHGTPNPLPNTLSSKRAHARALRAVLGSDAHTEACGATYHGHACTLHVGHTSNHLSRDENVNPVASWHDARDDDPQCSHLTRIPVLVVDPAEARQKVAEALFSMGFEAPWIYVDAVFAALGGQEQP